MKDFWGATFEMICERHPGMRKIKPFVEAHRSFLKRLFIILGTIGIIISCIEIPREIYRLVRNNQYYGSLDNKDYWPVHDYCGNNVNIFEFEDYLESCGAKNIIKGFYYKGTNTAICYDFYTADNVRFVLDNEIVDCGNGNTRVMSNLSIYDGDRIYKTDYIGGNAYVMDYRSPMWVDKKIFDLLHGIMDEVKSGNYSHSECPLKGSGIAHYEEQDGYSCWHNDVYTYAEVNPDNTTTSDDGYVTVNSDLAGIYRLNDSAYIEIFDVFTDGSVYFSMTVPDASGEESIYNEYNVSFIDGERTTFQITYQGDIYEVFRFVENGIEVSLDNGMKGVNDGLYIRDF